MGLCLNCDIECMVMFDFIYSVVELVGWVLIVELIDKEKCFCKKMGLEIVKVDVFEFIGVVVFV